MAFCRDSSSHEKIPIPGIKNLSDNPKVKNPIPMPTLPLKAHLFAWSYYSLAMKNKFRTSFSGEDNQFQVSCGTLEFMIITNNYFFIISVDSILNKLSCNKCLRMLELSLISSCLRNKTTIKSLFRPKFVTRSRNQTFWNVWDQNYLPWLVTQNSSTLRNQFLKPIFLRVWYTPGYAQINLK